MLSVEFHTHSAASYDGKASVEELLERAAAVGLDALAVTDHDEFAASERAVALAPEYGLVGIPGMEISTAAGHLLAFGIEEAVPAGLSFAESVERIHDQGGTAIVPHPYQESRSGVLAKLDPEDLLVADAIEVYNSRLITGWSNWQARTFATDHGLPMTAGSDAHVASEVGRAITMVDAAEPTAEGILEAVRAGRTEVLGRRTPWRVSFRQLVGNTRLKVRRFLGGDPE